MKVFALECRRQIACQQEIGNVKKTTIVYLADLAHTASVSDASIPIPLGIGYVAAYLHAYFGEAVEIKLFKHPERLMAAVLENPPTVVGMAHYGWSDRLNQSVGRRLRSLLPDALIVGGGPDIDHDDVLAASHLESHDYLDYYILEGGEEPFAELVDWWLASERKVSSLPQNTIWIEDGRLHKTETRSLKKTIEKVPSPYLDGFLDEFIDAGMMPLFETNRGCPFQCTFCAWGMASRNLVRRFSLETALAEIAYVGERSSARNWVVCDANFRILKRDVKIAQAIRDVKDNTGTPEQCHTWLAKNVTARNLEIAEILGDMVVSVMAVQSMDEDVLKAIKRDNISLDTYQSYQEKFHAIGSTTYSDVIVPLPGETLETHLDGLRKLFDFDVDIIQNHNCRMLAGCELNSLESRERWGFRTRYRLIHGDAGSYKAGPNETIECFEYEESLRETATMSEAELFFLRKVHFLVDFCWNGGVYKPILKYLRSQCGISPVDVFIELCGNLEGHKANDLASFWKSFDEFSQCEWFDSRESIETYFSDPANFKKLTGGDFEKINILYGIIAIRDFKPQFDAVFRWIFERSVSNNDENCRDFASVTFARFPPLHATPDESDFIVALDVVGYFDLHQTLEAEHSIRISLKPESAREKIKAVLTQSEGMTISKILNTQGFSLSDLGLNLYATQMAKNTDKVSNSFDS